MSQLFINLIGHNTSGKTTVAKRLEEDLSLNRISGDDFREFIHDCVTYFAGTDMSYPNERYNQLSPLVIHYRQELSWILLRAGQSVLFEGSGSKKAYRSIYLDKVKADFPNVIRVIIWIDTPEDELLHRLHERGKDWVRQYEELKKPGFEPPENHEAEVLLRYDQHNYDSVRNSLAELLHQPAA